MRAPTDEMLGKAISQNNVRNSLRLFRPSYIPMYLRIAYSHNFRYKTIPEPIQTRLMATLASVSMHLHTC